MLLSLSPVLVHAARKVPHRDIDRRSRFYIPTRICRRLLQTLASVSGLGKAAHTFCRGANDAVDIGGLKVETPNSDLI